MSTLDNAMFLKGENRRNFTMEFKCKAIEYVGKNRNHKAAENLMLLLKGLENGDKTN